MTGWWRRNAVIFDQAREDARLEPYLTWREKLARGVAALPLAVLGAVLSGVRELAPGLPWLYILLGAGVWVLATAWLIAVVTVRLRRRARQRRRTALQARRREAHRKTPSDPDALESPAGAPQPPKRI